MQKIMLTRKELLDIQKFMDAFPDTNLLTLEWDAASGIGSIIRASIDHKLNGYDTTVTVKITDESTW
jgi:hypothetical protein